ncbi:MAG: tetratricopeptide repeat protein [Longimicrobiales bacterium]
MKIRYGLVLTLAVGFGLTGCASGGGSSSGGGTSTAAPMIPGSETLAQGERPRDDDNTRAAQRAIEDADNAASDAAAETLYGQALESAEAAIAADATNPRAWRLAAEASMGLGDFVAADRFLTRAEELRPIYQFETEGMRERAWIGLYQEAVPMVNAGEYEEAAVLFEQANAIYDRRPEVFITLGQIYAQLRRHDEALENLDRAMEVMQSDIVAEMDSATVASWEEQAESIPMTRAQILADAGRMEEAVAAFRALSAEDPDNLMLKRNLATLLVQMDAEAEAFEVYADLMEMDGLTATDYYAIGVGYYQGEAYERAAQAFGAAAEVSVNDRDALEMWARSLQIDSAYTAIPAVAERWMELDPNNQNALLILAQALNQSGDGAAAGALVQRIEAMPVAMDNLQLQRFPDGGGQVSGSVINKTLSQGTPVQIEFTFYSPSGAVVGTQSTTVQAAGADMAQVFQVQFASDQTVGGYGYTLTTM